MMKKKKTLKKNPSKPFSYSTEFSLDINLNNFEGKLCAARINAFKDIFIHKRDYSTGGHNGSLKKIYWPGHSLLSLYSRCGASSQCY